MIQLQSLSMWILVTKLQSYFHHKWYLDFCYNVVEKQVSNATDVIIVTYYKPLSLYRTYQDAADSLKTLAPFLNDFMRFLRKTSEGSSFHRNICTLIITSVGVKTICLNVHWLGYVGVNIHDIHLCRQVNVSNVANLLH